MRFLQDMVDYLPQLAERSDHVLVLGDLNVGHTELDIKNWKGNVKNSGFLPEERAFFDTFFGDAGYVDVARALAGDVDGPYTWWSYRGKAFDNDTGWRIDYHMATPPWRSWLPMPRWTVRPTTRFAGPTTPHWSSTTRCPSPQAVHSDRAAIMNLTSITVRRLTIEMLTPFTTSFGTQTHRDLLIVEAHDDAGTVGYGECVAGAEPTYSEEATSTCEVALAEYIVPRLQNADVDHPEDISRLLTPIKRNNMAKASVEGAVWDLWAKQQGVSLAQALGEPRVESM